MVSDWGYFSLSLSAVCVRLAKRFFVCIILKIYRAHSACVFTCLYNTFCECTRSFLTINITGNRSLVGEFMLPGNDGTIIFVDIFISILHTAHVNGGALNTLFVVGFTEVRRVFFAL